jgi:GDPmannose 4,6-dehydratase
MPAKSALITGITGQDGWYLSEELRTLGYTVHGLLRPGERAGDERFIAHHAELTDAAAMRRAVAAAAPDECYHLAAQTSVAGEELTTFGVNAMGTLHVLEALRAEAPSCRLFVAGSSEMFGDPESAPQDEITPFRPRNVYGASKAAACHLLRVYRRQYGLYACCGILYNHESPRRGAQFVTRKITLAVSRIRAGVQKELRLGNLDARRDWGHARDYVRAMRLMLQQPQPDDFVIATGETHSVRDFAEAAFRAAGLDWRDYVQAGPEFYRPAEAVPLTGNRAKARELLGWSPEIPFTGLVEEMVLHDLTG